MIKVLGHWDIGYHAPITEQYYWHFPIRDFEVDEWHMTPKSGILSREPQVKLVEWNNYEEFFENNSELPRVFLEPRTKHLNPDTTWLHEFTHPKDCIYIFGSAHYNPTLKFKRKQDIVVSIKTIQDKGVLWADQVLCLVLYDRMIKNGSNSNR